MPSGPLPTAKLSEQWTKMEHTEQNIIAHNLGPCGLQHLISLSWQIVMVVVESVMIGGVKLYGCGHPH